MFYEPFTYHSSKSYFERDKFNSLVWVSYKKMGVNIGLQPFKFSNKDYNFKKTIF
jgi:hypothetical protein